MTDFMFVPLEGGGSLGVEVDSLNGPGVLKAGRAGQVVEQAAETLEAALASLIPGAIAVRDKLRAARPTEMELTFGIKLTAEAGAVIAKTAGECNFGVILRWQQIPIAPVE